MTIALLCMPIPPAHPLLCSVASVAGVVNFDAAKNADTHVHRIGRTGRIGADGAPMPGTAHTFIMPHESGIAAALTRNLQVGQF